MLVNDNEGDERIGIPRNHPHNVWHTAPFFLELPLRAFWPNGHQTFSTPRGVLDLRALLPPGENWRHAHPSALVVRSCFTRVSRSLCGFFPVYPRFHIGPILLKCYNLGPKGFIHLNCDKHRQSSGKKISAPVWSWGDFRASIPPIAQRTAHQVETTAKGSPPGGQRNGAPFLGVVCWGKEDRRVWLSII